MFSFLQNFGLSKRKNSIIRKVDENGIHSHLLNTVHSGSSYATWVTKEGSGALIMLLLMKEMQVANVKLFGSDSNNK